MSVNKISGEMRAALLRKSAQGMPDNPTQRGWKPDEIKRALFSYVLDEVGSIFAEINRIVDEINGKNDEQDEALAAAMETVGEDLEGLHGQLDALAAYVASLDLSDDRPVDMNSGTADVRGAIRAFIAYCLRHSVYPTQAEAVEAGRLRDAAAAYLSGGRWLEGAAYHVGEVVPPSPPVDPSGWSIDGSGDWVKIISVPASAIDAAGDYIKIGG